MKTGLWICLLFCLFSCSLPPTGQTPSVTSPTATSTAKKSYQGPITWVIDPEHKPEGKSQTVTWQSQTEKSFVTQAAPPEQVLFEDIFELNHYQKINGKSLCHKASGFATKC
jgi:hypothetical protein